MKSKQDGLERPGRLFGWALAFTGLAIVGALLVAWVGVAAAVVWMGIPLHLAALAMVRRFADFHRRWAGRQLGEPIPRPYRRIPASLGMWRRLLATIKDPATLRDILWLLVNATAGFTLTLLVASFWLGALWYVVQPLLWLIFPRL